MTLIQIVEVAMMASHPGVGGEAEGGGGAMMTDMVMVGIS